MSELKPVKDLHWDGDDLVIEFEDGTVIRFRNAVVTSVKEEYNPEDCIVAEEVQLSPGEPVVVGKKSG